MLKNKFQPLKIGKLQKFQFGAKKKKDPLEGVEFSGKFDEDAKTEVSEILSGFKKRAKDEEERKKIATDSEYWFSVVFISREQKEAFLRALGEDENDKMINGVKLAKHLGINIPDAKFSPTQEKDDIKLSKFIK